MINWQLKDLTETSWILSKDGTKTALVVATAEGIKVIGQIEKKLFASADELGEYLGGDITVESREVDNDDGDEIGQVNGYPIKHKAAFDIVEGDIVTYARAANSKARFAAGYYALEFGHGWTASYCPRLQTLEDNTYIGPYRTKLEMQNAMSQKKRVSKL